MHNILSDPTLNSKSLDRRSSADASDIRALIISPTRELAEQIAAEAHRVARGTGLKVQTAVGGTQKRQGLMRIQRDGCHLLVGTPGRLKDIFSDPSSRVSAPRLNTLILDEADRLLDQGFSEEIEAIQDLLPDPMEVDRQTLMFSATVPRDVMYMVRRTMKPDFKFIKTVRDDEVPTHLTVPQRTVFLRGYENALPAVLELVKNYQAKQRADPSLRPFKAIVYFNTTKEVQVAATTFQNLRAEPDARMSRRALGNMPTLEIHAGLAQPQRTRCAKVFREAKEGILFSTDVTARGMDFPDVTHVIQVGVPQNQETYIHRLGRTARANKTGEGWLFVHDGENNFYERTMRGLPLNEDSSSLPTAMVNMTQEDLSTASPATTLSIMQVRAAMKTVPSEVKESAYKAAMNLTLRSFPDKRQALRVLKDMAFHGYGLRTLPSINPKFAQMFGISKSPDVNLDSPSPGTDRGFGRDFGRTPGRGFDRRSGRDFVRGSARLKNEHNDWFVDGGSSRRSNNRSGGYGRRNNFDSW